MAQTKMNAKSMFDVYGLYIPKCEHITFTYQANFVKTYFWH